MKRILLGAAGTILSASLAFAQTTTTTTNNAMHAPNPGATTAPPTGSSMAPPSSSMAAPSTGSSMGAPATANPMGANHDSGKPAASGNANQAVVTTGANADQPAKGANSFTKRQATARIGKKGYTHVTGLTKDADGVWRGTGTKDGQPVQVWLDYKGNVGQQS